VETNEGIGKKLRKGHKKITIPGFPFPQQKQTKARRLAGGNDIKITKPRPASRLPPKLTLRLPLRLAFRLALRY